MEIAARLQAAQKRGRLPAVIAYNRIDGPGSSLDLREFQQALWKLVIPPADVSSDLTAAWSRSLPRTIGLTIDTGTRITAHPHERGKLAVQSVEYDTRTEAVAGEVPPTKANWLLKIIDIFDLSGVKFVLRNLKPGTHSAGLGGSATATTGVCILANELAGRPLGPRQLTSLASRMEHDLGVSITGTQEQSNVVFGGVTDYVWFPWGIPGQPGGGYGDSLRFPLVGLEHFDEIEGRVAIFHTGRLRASTDVNAVWTAALHQPEGFRLHARMPAIAHVFRESLRLRHWPSLIDAVKEYRDIRTALCGQYLQGSEEILVQSDARGGAAFPLGAGGGGGVAVYAQDPESLEAIRRSLADAYLEIPYKLREHGHDLVNLPLEAD
jgi:galactokinase/mevalonate kinase-like predicted kinase